MKASEPELSLSSCSKLSAGSEPGSAASSSERDRYSRDPGVAWKGYIKRGARAYF